VASAQAEHALRIYFVNYLHRTDWHRTPASTVVDEQGRTHPLATLDLLRQRLRTRHYSSRTESSYADWVRRFLAYVAECQGTPHPRVESAAARDFATHLAVHRRVSDSTQNQALSAILFLCREVLGVEIEGLSLAARAKRGNHLPVVLSVPETAALLDAMHGTTWLMAALIYGGRLRVSECCELRVKDIDFEQGLLVVRGGKGAKDRSTLLADLGREDCGHTSAVPRHVTAPIVTRVWPGCGCPRRWNASTQTLDVSWDGSGCFPVIRCRPIPALVSCVAIT
jgi:integrase